LESVFSQKCFRIPTNGCEWSFQLMRHIGYEVFPNLLKPAQLANIVQYHYGSSRSRMGAKGSKSCKQRLPSFLHLQVNFLPPLQDPFNCFSHLMASHGFQRSFAYGIGDQIESLAEGRVGDGYSSIFVDHKHTLPHAVKDGCQMIPLRSDRSHLLSQLLRHLFHVPGKITELVSRSDRDKGNLLTTGDLLSGRNQATHRTAYPLYNQPGGSRTDQEENQ